jgi:hypothetical protein
VRLGIACRARAAGAISRFSRAADKNNMLCGLTTASTLLCLNSTSRSMPTFSA